jgi:DNA-binding NarL/FixJ family response regulator
MAQAMRILLVDDDDCFREALTSLLMAIPGITVVAEAGNGREAVDIAAEVHPDLVLMDFKMPVLDGIAAARLIKAAARPPRVVICTAERSSEVRRAALDAGADAVVCKMHATHEIPPALRGGGGIAPGPGGRLAPPDGGVTSW